MLAIVAPGAILGWQGYASWRNPWLDGDRRSHVCAERSNNNLTQMISGGDPVQIALLKGLVAGCVITAIGFSRGAHLPGTGPLAGALVVGFLGYGVRAQVPSQIVALHD